MSASSTVPKDAAKAIEHDDLITLKSLLSSPITTADPNALNHLLALAVKNNSSSTFPYLIGIGASPYSDPVQSALNLSPSFPSLVSLIEQNLYDVNINLDRLGTHLILCIRRNNLDHVRTLLEHGANPNLGMFAHLYLPLAAAVKYDTSFEVINLLLAAGATIKESDALHIAVMEGKKDVVKLLVEKGADVNEMGFEYRLDNSLADRAGMPLHFAVDSGKVDMVKLLLDMGAEKCLKDVQDRTPLERAREKGDEEIITLMKKED
ncbi:MAG: hypothetical protein L6R39_007265 [Caloplaca ligustica]|nr:MAG: hypothetical protein L6R39_007265 [Caloplaca ligustica]